MIKAEYVASKNLIQAEQRRKLVKLNQEYALAHNTIGNGDIIRDNLGYIKVTAVGFVERSGLDALPCCAYLGQPVTEDGRKRNEPTRVIIQTNLIGDDNE